MKSRFSIQFLESSTEIMRAVAHPIRLSIVDLLSEKGPLSVSDIHNQLGIEQAIASHHLGILRNKGVVDSQREGKKTIYELRDTNIHGLIDIMASLQGVTPRAFELMVA
jgi:DNA-binding transcriptional ArsR family regulator